MIKNMLQYVYVFNKQCFCTKRGFALEKGLAEKNCIKNICWENISGIRLWKTRNHINSNSFNEPTIYTRTSKPEFGRWFSFCSTHLEAGHSSRGTRKCFPVLGFLRSWQDLEYFLSILFFFPKNQKDTKTIKVVQVQ